MGFAARQFASDGAGRPGGGGGLSATSAITTTVLYAVVGLGDGFSDGEFDDNLRPTCRA